LKTPRLTLLLTAIALGPWHQSQARELSLPCTARPLETTTYTVGGVVAIGADNSFADLQQQQITFTGNVELAQDTRRITADEIVYNQQQDTADATGSVVFTQPGLVLGGEQAHIDLRTNDTSLQPLRFQLPTIGGRGTGEDGQSRGTTELEAHQIDFTTCPQGDDSWYLEAKELKVNRDEGLAEARNAKLVFKGVPLLASPWLQFPIDDRRMSGLLTPSIGYSSRNGLDLVLPYYLNLAPNYDLTLSPRIISERGLLLGGEFRYLVPGHRGTVQAEILPHDRLYEGDNSLRAALRLDHASNWGERLRGRVMLNAVSDDQYLEDLGRDLGASSTVYLNSLAQLTYHGDTWKALARWHHQEVLGDSDRPLSRFPQLVFSSDRPIGGPFKLRFDSEYVNFERDVDATGQRFDIFPALRLDWREPWGYVKPQISGRYTSYSLDNVAAGAPDSPDRSLYSISLDSGLFFERETNLLGTAGIQTLEPRLFYLYTPYRDQSELPVFDSTIPDLSYPNLFRENRFTGIDRIGDANQLTLGLSTRFIEEQSLRERFRASIGQILYFSDRRVQLDGDPVETDDSSPLVGELDLTLSDHWSTTAVLQWDPHDNEAENSLLRLGYRDNGKRRMVNLAYRYDPVHDQEYTDLSFDWPLSERYRLVARWEYSLSADRTMEALGGLEYDTCCWRVRSALRRYITNTEGEYDTAFFLQLELKGLGRLGDNIDQLLRRSLYSYDHLDRYRDPF